MIRLALLAICLALPAAGQEVVADLSQNRVSITTDFTGSEILIYGAIKRSGPPEDDPLEIVVTVQGPLAPVTVRRKERVGGIWVNTDWVEVDAAPSFYAVATTAPLTEVLSYTADLRWKVSIPYAIRSVGAPMQIANAAPFSDALIRLRTDEGVYQLRPNTVTLREGTLFSTRIDLPANLIEGEYSTRIFLTRDRAVVSVFNTVINVQKVGLERVLYTLATERPLVYGLLAVAIAMLAGWIASTVFRYLRG